MALDIGKGSNPDDTTRHARMWLEKLAREIDEDTHLVVMTKSKDGPLSFFSTANGVAASMAQFSACLQAFVIADYLPRESRLISPEKILGPKPVPSQPENVVDNERGNATAQAITGLSTTALVIFFIWLKVTGQVAWAWWLVLSPIWIMPAFFLAVVGIAIVGILGIKIIQKVTR